MNAARSVFDRSLVLLCMSSRTTGCCLGVVGPVDATGCSYVVTNSLEKEFSVAVGKFGIAGGTSFEHGDLHRPYTEFFSDVPEPDLHRYPQGPQIVDS